MSRSVSDVTVITVNWNGKHHLRSLLPSLTPLSAGEIIVVDNGSQDDSVPFLQKEYPQVRVLENKTNRGFAQPNNLGAEKARGKVLAFINNDMRAHPRWLSAALEGLQHCCCTGSQILNWEGTRIDFNGSSLQYLGYALQQDSGKPAERVSHRDRILFPCGGAMLIDREVFLRLGGFDEDYFAIYEDVDLGWRLWLSGHQVSYSPDSIVFHRGHSTLAAQGSAKTRYLMHRNALLTILKNYEEESFRRVLPLALLMALKRAVRCSGARKESFYLWSATRSRLEAEDSAAALEVLDALNHVVAVEDILESYPAILEKRRKVQALRKRTDAEILHLFEDPLRPIVEDVEYIDFEVRNLKALGLDELFGALETSEYEKLGSGIAEDLQLRVARLRDELRALQWVGTQALTHPPSPRKSRIRSLLCVLRVLGLKGAWRHFWGKLHRGL